MNKTYKIQLPQNKEAQNIKISIKDGTIEVEVELKEKWEPKEGEIYYIKACYEHIFIFNKLDDEVTAYIVFTPCSKQLSNLNKTTIVCNTDDIIKFRPAADFEKQLLFDALAKQGKMWDAEKKAVVDLPKPRVEVKEHSTSSEKDIDWEERRYEIAKAMMMALEKHNNNVSGFRDATEQAQYAIDCADALIAELKKGGER